MRASLLIALTVAVIAPGEGRAQDWRVVPFPTDPQPIVLDMDMDGATVWFSTSSKGLLAYDGTTWVHHVQADGGLRSNWHKNTMFVDRSGDKWTVRENPMWLDRLDDGGTFSDKSDDVWTYYNQAPDQLQSGRVFSMEQDLAGNMWFGIRDEANTSEVPSMLELLIENGPGTGDDDWLAFGDTYDPPIFVHAQDVRGLEMDTSGRLWIIYDRAGIDVWDFGVYDVFDDDVLVHYGAIDGLPSDAVYSVHAAPDGRVWVGADGGLSVLDPASGIWAAVDGVPGTRVNAIDSDAQGHIWVGTDGGVAMLYRTGEVAKVFTALVDDLHDDYISLLAVDSVVGNVWAISVDAESRTTLNLLDTGYGSEPRVFTYPNPWREGEAPEKSVKILGVPDGSTVEVFDITGQRVRKLDATREPYRWDSLDTDLNEVASGVYIVRVVTPSGEQLFTKAAIIR